MSLENSVITDNNKLAILVLSSNDSEPVTQEALWFKYKTQYSI